MIQREFNTLREIGVVDVLYESGRGYVYLTPLGWEVIRAMN